MIFGNIFIELPTSIPELNVSSLFYVAFAFLAFVLCRPFKSFLRPYFLFALNILFIYSFSLTALKLVLVLALLSYVLSLVIRKGKIVSLLVALVPMILVFSWYKYRNYQGVLLPLGLSYYSFKIISYLIDVYKGEIELEKNLLYYLDYVCFFPCITAGPINRAKGFLQELKKPSEFDYGYAKSGGFLLLMGIFEKVVFCDYLAYVGSLIVANVELSGTNVLIGVLLYAYELYLNFDAISNIAIGTGRLLGFDLGCNFKAPYLADSLKEFWGRWHISLSSWLRDYIYIPLGGNRKGLPRKYLNIVIVFLISAIWHGTAFHFLVWGLLNALVEIVEDLIGIGYKKLCLALSLEKLGSFIVLLIKPFMIIFSFVLVAFLWQIFKGANVLELIKLLTVKQPFSYELIGLTRNEFRWLIFILVTLTILEVLRDLFDVSLFFNRLPAFVRWPLYLLFIVSFMVFGVYGGHFEAGDFIYQFF